jgi:hypothetical protein
MTDDVQREIEANERRARDQQDVGVEEDVLRQNDDDGTFLDDALDGIPGIGDNDSEKHDVEYGDNEGANRFQPS